MPPARPRRTPRLVPAVEPLETRLTPAVTFAAQQTFAVGSDPAGAAVADWNGDGRPDLAITNNQSNNVSILLNTAAAGASTPAFAAAATFALGTNPAYAVAADLNGDGRPDLIVANGVGDTVSVLLNTTPAGAAVPSFAAQQTFADGGAALQVVAADFNGDGRPDLAAADFNSGAVTVLLNTTPVGAATASFTSQLIPAGNGPEGIAAQDLNGDGRPDLVVTNYSSGTLTVLLNTTAAGAATASFAARQTFATGANPRWLAAADFNGDGRPDLAVVEGGGNAVSVFLNTTAPGAAGATFAARQSFAAGTDPFTATAGDFDGDGRPDIAFTNQNGSTVAVMVNATAAGAATPAFAAEQTFAVTGSTAELAAADINGDGRADLAVAAAHASVLLNTTTPYATAAPVVVGQFGNTGVWEYNRTAGTWGQLTAANASVLAADSAGDVVGDFPGNGVWEYRPTAGWKQLNGVDAAVLALNDQGEIVASFPGYGVAEYLPATGWRSLTPSAAYLLAVDGLGDVAGAFHGYGIQFYRPATGWAPLNGVDPTLLALDPQGDVYANFHGVGVAAFRAVSGWKVLNGVEASALAVDANGDVFAEFPGYGVGEYVPAAGWHTSTLANAALLGADALAAAVGEFAGAGVWAYDPAAGWHQLRTQDTSLLVIA